MHSAWIVTLAVLLPGPFLCAQNARDVAGSRDHAILSRFPGAWIRFFEEKAFDTYALRTGPISGDSKAGSSLPLEGKITRILYQHEKALSSLEIFRNYEQALLQAGFRPVWRCEGETCGARFGYSYPTDNAPHILSFSRNQRYLAVERAFPESRVHVAIYVVETHDGPATRLDVVESRPMQGGQIAVSAAEMKADIGSRGKAVLYNLYFDSGKAELKPESEPGLREIGRLMQENPGLQLFVVGHTDAVGSFEANRELSLRRAQAVVQALSLHHGVAGARLSPQGVASLAPLASNDSEEGRSLNRRVELVKR